MGNVLIHSRNFNGSLQEWGERLLYRARNRALADWREAPDILSFELGKQPEKISRPTELVRKATKFADPEGFYELSEWEWSQRFPSPRGF